MDIQALVDRLQRFPPIVQAVLDDLAEADRIWTPPHGGWSVAQILGHLLCEERQDFRPRLERLWHDADEAWDTLHPEGAVAQGDWADCDATMAAFSEERRASVEWLRAMPAPDMAAQKTHPTFGSMTAGELLGAWVAHDALHLRQLSRRMHELSVRDAAPFGVDYAGEW